MEVIEPTSFRLTATLGFAGLVSGLVLVGVYLSTLPAIERNQAEALQRAIFKVLPGTEDVTAHVLDGQSLVAHDASMGKPEAAEVVYAGKAKDGTLLGYAVPAEGNGFMDTIKLLYGFDAKRRVVVGMEVLESRETPGLGDKILADPGFHANFKALVVEPSIVAVKKGAKANANEVDCITGATISSKAVVSILNNSFQQWLPRLTGEGGER